VRLELQLPASSLKLPRPGAVVLKRLEEAGYPLPDTFSSLSGPRDLKPLSKVGSISSAGSIRHPHPGVWVSADEFAASVPMTRETRGLVEKQVRKSNKEAEVAAAIAAAGQAGYAGLDEKAKIPPSGVSPTVRAEDLPPLPAVPLAPRRVPITLPPMTGYPPEKSSYPFDQAPRTHSESVQGYGYGSDSKAPRYRYSARTDSLTLPLSPHLATTPLSDANSAPPLTPRSPGGSLGVLGLDPAKRHTADVRALFDALPLEVQALAAQRLEASRAEAAREAEGTKSRDKAEGRQEHHQGGQGTHTQTHLHAQPEVEGQSRPGTRSQKLADRERAAAAAERRAAAERAEEEQRERDIAAGWERALARSRRGSRKRDAEAQEEQLEQQRAQLIAAQTAPLTPTSRSGSVSDAGVGAPDVHDGDARRMIEARIAALQSALAAIGTESPVSPTAPPLPPMSPRRSSLTRLSAPPSAPVSPKLQATSRSPVVAATSAADRHTHTRARPKATPSIADLDEAISSLNVLCSQETLGAHSLTQPEPLRAPLPVSPLPPPPPPMHPTPLRGGGTAPLNPTRAHARRRLRESTRTPPPSYTAVSRDSSI
jgi:hypothetical protein